MKSNARNTSRCTGTLKAGGTQSCPSSRHSLLELLLFLEEHGKADDSSINQKTAKDRHDHSWDFDRSAVS